MYTNKNIGKGGDKTKNSWHKKQGLYRLSYERVLSEIHRVDKLTELQLMYIIS